MSDAMVSRKSVLARLTEDSGEREERRDSWEEAETRERVGIDESSTVEKVSLYLSHLISMKYFRYMTTMMNQGYT